MSSTDTDNLPDLDFQKMRRVSEVARGPTQPLLASSAPAPATKLAGSPSADLFADSPTFHQERKARRLTDDGERKTGNLNPWEGAKRGNVTYVTPVENPDSTIDGGGHEEHEVKLNEIQATSIAGNDIASSVLYSSGLVMQTGGRMAPICIAFVGVVLHLFRGVYAEVGSALPLNGGTYNALLNTSTKTFASIAACLTILSYTATAVVSASSAAEYVALELSINTTVFTIAILAVFAILTVMGISDSANVATVIFVAHIGTISAVLIASIVYCVNDGFSTFSNNWRDGSSIYGSPHRNIYADLFYGFGTAMLGVTGFESSANYIEEQAPGVFPKTLDNMWMVVSFFNPMICLFSMGVVRMSELNDEVANSLLAHVADRAAGSGLRLILIIDAAIVLSGGVLTAYVGMVGLVRRLALDRCLPFFLLSTNKWRGTNHWTILAFFLVTSSLRLMVSDMNTLGGVYGIAFLSVMSMFTVGNMLLKYKRNKLPRTPVCSYPHVLMALVFVVTGLVANITKSTETVAFFLLYATVTIALVIGMFSRVQVLRFFVHLIGKKSKGITHKIGAVDNLVDWMQRHVHEIRGVPLMFFAKHPTLSILNKALIYVLNNENTSCFRIVYVYRDREVEKDVLAEFEDASSILDRMYPKLTIELFLVEGEFSPLLLDRLSKELSVPKNFMFMCCPGDKFPHQIGKFGGVRVITH